jgi:small subunit ribosomal protein S17
MPEHEAVGRGVRKHRRGVVVSRSGNKTIVVRVETREPHPFYGKVVRKLRKFHVHDEKNEAAVGNTVRIVECRPLSRLKRWRLLEVVPAGAPAR